MKEQGREKRREREGGGDAEREGERQRGLLLITSRWWSKSV